MFNWATPHTSIAPHTQLTLNNLHLPSLTQKHPQTALMNCVYWVIPQMIISWTFSRVRQVEGLTCAQCPWPSPRSGSTRLQGNQSFQSWSSCACLSGWCDCGAWSRMEGIRTASRRWSRRETTGHSSEGSTRQEKLNSWDWTQTTVWKQSRWQYSDAFLKQKSLTLL